MNTSVYCTLVVAIAVLAESPSSYTPKSVPGESTLKSAPFEQNSEMPATLLELHHTTATVKIKNTIPYKTALMRSSFSVPRLTKSFNNDYDPFFIQNNYIPAETRHKMIKVVSFRRNRLQPRIILQNKEMDSTAAEIQSLFNELPDFSIDSEK